MTELQEAVYAVLQSSPVPLQVKDIYAGVKAKAPRLCDDSAFPCRYCGGKHPLWQHQSAWALQLLKQKKLIYSPKRGFWNKVSATIPDVRPIPTMPEGEHTHENLKRKIKEIGEILGRYAQEEYSARPYIYDVIWKDIEGLPRPSHVFEVQDKGAVDSALAKLQHARDMWKPNLFLVVTGERDRRKINMLLEPFFEGAFHSLRRDTIVLTPEAINDIHHAFNENKEVIGHFLEP